MLLTELTAPKGTRISEINRYLRECYGYRINVGASTHQLAAIQSQVKRELREMKLAGATPQDAEYSRKLMIHEGVRALLRQRQLMEERAGAGAGVFNRVCARLGEYACECVNTGDSVDEAVGSAMRVYRSSRYRFPDAEVEGEIRECINSTFECGGHEVNRGTLMDSEWSDDDFGASVEDIQRAVFYRISRQYPEQLRNLDRLENAILDVAESHQGGDLGSSDISIMTREVLEQLDMNETVAGAIAQ